MLLGIAWSEGIYECQCFSNEFEDTETHMPMNTSCNMILPHSMDFVCYRSQQFMF